MKKCLLMFGFLIALLLFVSYLENKSMDGNQNNLELASDTFPKKLQPHK